MYQITNSRHIKNAKKIVRWIVGIILGFYIGLITLLNIPYIQQKAARITANELGNFLQTKVDIGNINIGFFNRIVINDLQLNDTTGEKMLYVTRLSAKFELLPLFKKRISISSAQLFGFDFNLHKNSPEERANFQFLLDKFARKEPPKDLNLDLRINSILIRRGKLSYHVLTEPETPGIFNKNHLDFQNIIANISVKALRNDSINATVRRLCVTESLSGFTLSKLKFKVLAGAKDMTVSNFAIELPKSALNIDSLTVKYDSLKLLPKQLDKAEFKLRTAPSFITLSDISAVAPALSEFNEPLAFGFNFNGKINEFNCPTFTVKAGNNIQFTADLSINNITSVKNALLHGKVSKLYINEQGFDFIFRNLKNNRNKELPAYLRNLKYFFFRGDISGYFTDIVLYGQLHTGVGAVNTDIKLSVDREKHIFSYSGDIKTSDFFLGGLFPNQKFGYASLDVNIIGQHQPNRYPNIVMNGAVTDFDYSNYTYNNIILNAAYNRGGFEGEISLDDENIKLDVNGSFNTALKKPEFNLTTVLSEFHPDKLNLFHKDLPGLTIGAKLTANFTGSQFDDLNGEIRLDSLNFQSSEKQFFLKQFRIDAQSDKEGSNTVSIESPFLKGNLTGKFKYNTLYISMQNLLHDYMPALVKESKSRKKPDNTFVFGFDLYDTELFATVFNIPMHIYTHSTIRGSYDDKTRKFRAEGYFPQMQYKKNYIESGMFLLENREEDINCKFRITALQKNKAINLALGMKAADNQAHITLDWGNNQAVTYSGKIAAIADFVRNEETGKLKTFINLKPTDIILNDTLWNMHTSDIIIESGKVDINNFFFSNGKQYIKANGTMSSQDTDQIQLDLQDIDLGYVFDIAQLSNIVSFEGKVTGSATANSVFTKPELEARLHISDFKLNNGLLGETNIYGTWVNERKAIYLDAYIQNKLKAVSHAEGYIYPIKPNGGLELTIDANRLNVKFLEHYMNNIARDIKGEASGKVKFYGKFKKLNLEGALHADAFMTFDVLGTSFRVNDSIRMHKDGITFKKVKISDKYGNPGSLDGYLHYKHFKDLKYRFNINAKKMLIMDIPESLDFPFNGKIYGTGNAHLSGDMHSGLEVNAAFSTDKNTSFTYSIGTIASATSNQFIKFVDKTPKSKRDSIRIMSQYEMLQQQQQAVADHSKTDIRLNIQVDATEDAAVKILMDPVAGDNISGRGTGNIRMEYYNKGDVKLFGNYRINKGIYKFSLQEVIRKDFLIQNGSTITFNGAPLDANMDIHAVYTVPSASVSDLIPEATQFIQQPNVRVNCLMDLSGPLVHPNIKFGISLPNERDEVQSLIRNYISTEEQMNMQILYLLGIGKFYTENNLNDPDRQSSNMMSSVISSTLSGQLNNMLSQIIDNSNWNIGTNLSTGEKGWTDVEVEGILSGQLLNNRLLINGNFGYRDNPMANTNFIGDFEAEFLLTRNGEYRLRAYNETNDRYYTKTNLTTQGIGFIYRKEYEKWKELLFWNNWKLKRKRRRLEKLKKEQQLKEQKKQKTQEQPLVIQPEKE